MHVNDTPRQSQIRWDEGQLSFQSTTIRWVPTSVATDVQPVSHGDSEQSHNNRQEINEGNDDYGVMDTRAAPWRRHWRWESRGIWDEVKIREQIRPTNKVFLLTVSRQMRTDHDKEYIEHCDANESHELRRVVE